MKKLVLCLFILVLTSTTGYSEFILPDSLIIIEEYAFSGTAAEFVKLPENTEIIGKSAFAANRNLRIVYIPNSVTAVGAEAFDNSRVLSFIGFDHSYGEEWAKAQNRRFIILTVIEAYTHKRALLFSEQKKNREERLVEKTVELYDAYRNVHCRTEGELKASKTKGCTDYKIANRAPPYLGCCCL